MAFGAVEITFYEDMPKETNTGQVVNEHAVGYYSGANGSNTAVPGNATYCTIYTQADSYARLQSEATTPAANAGIAIPAKTLMGFRILPHQTVAQKVYFALA